MDTNEKIITDENSRQATHAEIRRHIARDERFNRRIRSASRECADTGARYSWIAYDVSKVRVRRASGEVFATFKARGNSQREWERAGDETEWRVGAVWQFRVHEGRMKFVDTKPRRDGPRIEYRPARFADRRGFN